MPARMKSISSHGSKPRSPLLRRLSTGCLRAITAGLPARRISQEEDIDHDPLFPRSAFGVRLGLDGADHRTRPRGEDRNRRGLLARRRHLQRQYQRGRRGLVAGNVGTDTIVVVGATTLSTPDNGSNGLPVITDNLVITSPDPTANSSINHDPALGTPDFRLLEIGTGAVAPTVTLRRLNLARGRVQGSFTLGGIPSAGAGGCILLRNGSLTVVDSVIEECTAVGIDNANGPAGEAWGGAIAATADFACDSGAFETQGLLNNPGFEDPLDATTNWSCMDGSCLARRS
jgi:hypothetical protein